MKIEKITELLNILNNYFITIDEHNGKCEFYFKKINKRNVFEKTYDISTLKFKNNTEVSFRDFKNEISINFVDCLVKYNLVDKFCDELEKRIIQSN
jgi:hypothetical protein